MPRFNYINVTSRDASAEAILEDMAELRAKKIALWSENMTSGGAVQETTYSKNLDIVAGDLISGNANIMVLGDSINNPSQAGYMRSGYMNSWEPNYWRGLCPALSNGNSGQNGMQISGALGANVTGVSTGNGPDPGNPAFAGTSLIGVGVSPQETNTALVTTDATGTIGNGNFEGFRLNNIESGIDAYNGTQQTSSILEGTQFQYRCLLFSPTGGDIGVYWRRGSPNATTQSNYTLSVGYNVIESPIFDNSNYASYSGASQIYFTGGAGEQISLLNVEYVDLATTGMRMSYMGGGGFQVANHVLQDNSAPIVSGTGRPAWYGDASAQANLNFLDANIVWIHLGNNNANEADVEAYIPGLINRFRSLKSDMKFVLVSPYDGDLARNPDPARFQAQVDYYKDLAGSSGYTDVGFLDMRTKIIDDLGPYANWQATNLVDGLHPSQAGANTFASIEWDIIEESNSAPAGSPGGSFPITIDGDQEYSALLACIKRVK